MEIGINPNEAASAGTATAGVAGDFRTLTEDFRTAIGDAKKAAGEPEVIGGYEPFGVDWVDALTEVEEHGTSLGNNTVSAAAYGVNTDTAIGDGFRAVAGRIPNINV